MHKTDKGASQEVPTIIFFNTTKAWGGGEKWHLEMALSLRSHGIRIAIFAHPAGVLYTRARAQGLPVIAYKTSKLSFLNVVKVNKLAALLRSLQASAILLNLPQDMKLAGLAAKKAHIQHIIYRRGSAIPIKNSVINRFYFRKIINGVIANTQVTAQTILQNNAHLFPSEKIHVIHNGIDLDWYNSFPPKNEKNKKLIIGTAARFEKQKGLHHIIGIAQILRATNLQFEIHLAGEGSLLGEMKEAVQQNQLQEYIHFVGFQTDIRPFMQSLDVFVLTSHWEGFGYVLVEAMAYAKPVVAFHISSNPEIVAHKQTGLLVPPFSEKAFAEAIMFFADEAVRNEYGKRGKERVYSMFSQETATQKVLEVLKLSNKP